MRKLGGALFLIPGLINLYPIVGVAGTEPLQSLYGLAIAGPDLALLLRHRAVLLGLVGAFLIAAAFRPALRPLAMVAGLISMLSFIALALPLTAHNAAITRIVWADAIACLLVACAAMLSYRRSASRPTR